MQDGLQDKVFHNIPHCMASFQFSSADNSWIHESHSPNNEVYLWHWPSSRPCRYNSYIVFPVAGKKSQAKKISVFLQFFSRTLEKCQLQQLTIPSSTPSPPREDHSSKLLARLLAGIVYPNYQQKNQTQRSGNTYSPNQPDSALAWEAHILIQSDLLQASSPLIELSFTSEWVIEWRKIYGVIHKGNHRTALAI